MEECAAYGTCNTQQTRGRGDIAVGECPAYGVVEGKQWNNEDDAYENIETTTPSLQTKGSFIPWNLYVRITTKKNVFLC